MSFCADDPTGDRPPAAGDLRFRQADAGACSQCNDEIVDGWSLSLDSWIVRDGNYPDLAGGQQAEFAIEFYFPEPRELDDAWENARDV